MTVVVVLDAEVVVEDTLVVVLLIVVVVLVTVVVVLDAEVVVLVTVVVVLLTVVVVEVIVDVHGTLHSCGQCCRAKLPWAPKRWQSSFGILEPQPAASTTPLQDCGIYVVVDTLVVDAVVAVIVVVVTDVAAVAETVVRVTDVAVALQPSVTDGVSAVLKDGTSVVVAAALDPAQMPHMIGHRVW